ncbi:MAG: ABC transporter ATP-binding protein [Acidimicrobiales bacterium]
MPLLEVDDLRAGYGRIEVLHELSVAVPEGCVVALLGPNGSGKTTTLRAISGTLPVRGGSIRFDGRRVDNRRPSDIAAGGLVLIPEGRGIFAGLSVRENLRIAHRSATTEVAGPWDEWFALVVERFPWLPERLEQRAGSLSGGEQQMLALTRALVGQPRLVMFDELSMGLAPLVVEMLFEQVARLRDEGRTILLVEQYVTQALLLADLCYVLAKGRVAWCGEPAELRCGMAVPGFLEGSLP